MNKNRCNVGGLGSSPLIKFGFLESKSTLGRGIFHNPYMGLSLLGWGCGNTHNLTPIYGTLFSPLFSVNNYMWASINMGWEAAFYWVNHHIWGLMAKMAGVGAHSLALIQISLSMENLQWI